MKLLISPAKKMREDTDFLAPKSVPALLERARVLADWLRGLDYPALKKLLSCNDAIAELNFRRYQEMDFGRANTPALLAYDGIQYQYMAPQLFTAEQFAYAEAHLRILSGLYGVLRPFDGVTPYRLEMGARLAVDGCRDLYAFWGGKLARALAGESGWVLDLASKEYSRAVLPHLPPSLRVVTCVFGELRPDGKVVEKGTLCKMARGEMVRWLAETGTAHPDGLPAFQGLGYRYDPDRSTGARMVFLKTTQSSAV